MEKPVLMPKLSAQMTKGILTAWVKHRGDAVKKGDVLFEIETEKVISEVESPENGVLVKIFFDEGDEVHADERVAIIDVG